MGDADDLKQLVLADPEARAAYWQNRCERREREIAKQAAVIGVVRDLQTYGIANGARFCGFCDRPLTACGPDPCPIRHALTRLDSAGS